MMRSIVLAAAAAGAICGLPAAAQDVECDTKKTCSTDHIEYDPDAKDGFVVFGNVGVYFDGHRVWKLVDKPSDDVDVVYVELGSCKMNIFQPHMPLPPPADAPDLRRAAAREEVDLLAGDLKKTAAVLSVSEPELLKDDPGFVQYQVTSRWIGYLGKGELYEVRRITVGYYQMIEKWCKAGDTAAAQKLYDEHRVRIRTEPDK